MKQRTQVLGIIIVAAIFVVGCSSTTPTSQVSPLATPATVSVEPTSFDSALPTPEEASPGETVLVEGLVFSLDEPLTAGDTEVTGTGPKGIPIVIADLTLMGEVMGRGTIGPDGRFEIQIAPPLIVNHRIGVMLDAESIELEFTQEVLDQLETFKGKNAITIPRIGAVFDAASVVP